jgi:hypothetical protein
MSDIGLYELISSGGLSFFGIMMTMLVRHFCGMLPNLSVALNKFKIKYLIF